MKPRFPGRRTREGGQSLVEFALILPIFMVLVLGLFDGARAVWNYNTLAEAAREGSRYAIVNSGAAASDIEGVVRDHGSGLNQASLSVTVTPSSAPRDVGSTVEVRAEYDFDPLFAIVGLPSITMSSTSRMTIQH